jgi:hypothetical protein
MAFKKTKTALIIEFHALLRQTGQTENKAVMVGSFGKESTRDLSTKQLEVLVGKLRELVPGDGHVTKALRKQRSIVLGLLQDMGIIGWDRVNPYLEDKRIFGKRLGSCFDIDETKALVRKLRTIARREEKKAQEENYLAKNN